MAPSGIAVARLSDTFKIPAFFALGESHNTIEQFGAERAKEELKDIAGVIAVSTYLKRWIVDHPFCHSHLPAVQNKEVAHNHSYPDSLILRIASATPSINSKSSMFRRKPTYLLIVPSRSRNIAFCLFFRFFPVTRPSR